MPVATILATLMLLLAPPALADDGLALRGWGLRAGLTLDPDQVHVGAHADLGEIVPQLRFMPNLEVGFGDDRTVVALNGELAWMFRNLQLNLPENAGIWRPYLGGGLGLIFVDRDLPPHHRGDDTETDLGINLLGGLERRLKNDNRFFFELKIGLSDAPDGKLTLGITF
jgi:hypothetical protein